LRDAEADRIRIFLFLGFYVLGFAICGSEVYLSLAPQL
jgi:hypothetical protein